MSNIQLKKYIMKIESATTSALISAESITVVNIDLQNLEDNECSITFQRNVVINNKPITDYVGLGDQESVTLSGTEVMGIQDSILMDIAR